MNEVWDFHDQLSAILRRQNRLSGGMFDIPENFEFVGIKYPQFYNGFEFQQILSTTRLDEESDYMGHCVHGYKYSCAKGTSIIFSAKGPDGKRYTVEYNPDTFTFVQAEGAKRDNSGMRNICDRDLINTIFIPYASVISKENRKYSYKSLCTFNKVLQVVKDKAYGLEGALDHYPNNPMLPLEESLCHTNYALEDLIEIAHDLENGKIKDSFELIALIETIHEKHKLIEGDKPRTNVGPIEPRRRAQAVRAIPPQAAADFDLREAILEVEDAQLIVDDDGVLF